MRTKIKTEPIRKRLSVLILLTGALLLCLVIFPLGGNCTGTPVELEAAISEEKGGGALAEISLGKVPEELAAGYLELTYGPASFTALDVAGGELLDGVLLESNIGEKGVIKIAWLGSGKDGKGNAGGVLLKITFKGVEKQLPLKLGLNKMELLGADGGLIPFKVRGEGLKYEDQSSRDAIEIHLQIGSREARVNGSPAVLGAPPFLQKGRTMVPLRFISEQLGAEVSWLSETRQVEIKDDRRDILLTVDSSVALVGGNREELDSPALLVGGATYVPLRFVGTILGAGFAWDEAEQLVTITRS